MHFHSLSPNIDFFALINFYCGTLQLSVTVRFERNFSGNKLMPFFFVSPFGKRKMHAQFFLSRKFARGGAQWADLMISFHRQIFFWRFFQIKFILQSKQFCIRWDFLCCIWWYPQKQNWLKIFKRKKCTYSIIAEIIS